MARLEMPHAGEQFLRKNAQGMIRAAEATMVEVTDLVVERTPAKTGRARSNWVASVGAPSGEVRDAEDPSGGPSKQQARSVFKGLAVGALLIIQNNLPYAGMLENGWSEQAPAGMLKVSWRQAPAIYRRNLRSRVS